MLWDGDHAGTCRPYQRLSLVLFQFAIKEANDTFKQENMIRSSERFLLATVRKWMEMGKMRGTGYSGGPSERWWSLRLRWWQGRWWQEIEKNVSRTTVSKPTMLDCVTLRKCLTSLSHYFHLCRNWKHNSIYFKVIMSLHVYLAHSKC